MREQFEKLPEIAEIIKNEKAVFVGDGYRIRGNDRAEAYLDGAWYAYQEQQERFNKRRPELDSDTCSDIRNHISPLTRVIDR